MENPRQVNLKVKGLIDQLWKDTKNWKNYANQGERLLLPALKKWPNDIILSANLGAIYDYQFKRNEAYAQIERAIKMGANDRDTLFNYGVVKTNLGRSDAKDFFKAAQHATRRDDTFACYIDFHAL